MSNNPEKQTLNVTIGLWNKGEEDSVICNVCRACYEGDYANNWHDDWKHCPNCGRLIIKED